MELSAQLCLQKRILYFTKNSKWDLANLASARQLPLGKIPYDGEDCGVESWGINTQARVV